MAILVYNQFEMGSFTFLVDVATANNNLIVRFVKNSECHFNIQKENNQQCNPQRIQNEVNTEEK